MVCVLLADGFEEIEALTPIDTLRRAGCEVVSVGITGKTATGSHGISVICDAGPDEAEKILNDNKIEMLILPGGMPGTKNLDGSELTDLFINSVSESGGYLAAICAAPMVIGKRGFLESKKGTCYPGFEKYLHGAAVSEERVVLDGNVITSRGPGTALEFSLELLRILKGNDVCGEVRAAMLV